MGHETSFLTLVMIVSQKLEPATTPGSNSGRCHGIGINGFDHVSQLKKKKVFLGLMVSQKGSQWKLILFAKLHLLLWQ